MMKEYLTMLGIFLGVGLFGYLSVNYFHLFLPSQIMESAENEPCYQIDCQTYHSEFGFSFKYPSHLFVLPDPETGRLVLLNSLKYIKDEPITAVVISTLENNPPMTPLERMKSSNSSYDISKGYVETDIDGQKAIAVENWTWIVVNTPDNKRFISIELFPDESNSLLLFSEMGVVVNSLIFDK